MVKDIVIASFSSATSVFMRNPLFFLRENDFVCFLYSRLSLKLMGAASISPHYDNTDASNCNIVFPCLTSKIHTESWIGKCKYDLAILPNKGTLLRNKKGSAFGSFETHFDALIEVKVAHGLKFSDEKLVKDLGKLNKVKDRAKHRFLFFADFRNPAVEKYRSQLCGTENDTTIFYCTRDGGYRL